MGVKVAASAEDGSDPLRIFLSWDLCVDLATLCPSSSMMSTGLEVPQGSENCRRRGNEGEDRQKQPSRERFRHNELSFLCGLARKNQPDAALTLDCLHGQSVYQLLKQQLKRLSKKKKKKSFLNFLSKCTQNKKYIYIYMQVREKYLSK